MEIKLHSMFSDFVHTLYKIQVGKDKEMIMECFLHAKV
jgi:hypothetical protein